MDEIIKAFKNHFWNRRGLTIRLDKVEEDIYEVSVKDSLYYRVGGNLGEDIEYIDFDSGPFISKGSKFGTYYVKHISKGNSGKFLITIWKEKDTMKENSDTT